MLTLTGPATGRDLPPPVPGQPAGTVIHLALDPPPDVRRVLEVTDVLRETALSHLGHWPFDSRLAGKTAGGECMRGHRHEHVHWLPVPDGRDLIGICAWSPAPLAPREAECIRRLDRSLIWDRSTGLPCRVHLAEKAGGLPAMLARPSSAWESLTPFVPPRWVQRSRRRERGGVRGKIPLSPEAAAAHVAESVAAELAARGLPAAARVEDAGPARGWVTSRPSRPAPVPQPCHVRVTFPVLVEGPLALGKLSHFGLGLFRPAGG